MSVSELPLTAAIESEERRIQGFDLLRLQPIATLVRWAGFPYVFQAALLAIFVALAVLAWGVYPPDGVPDKLFAKSNLVNLLVWGLWWPAMVWTAVLLGRVWCAVCPLELLANGSERLARGLGVKQRVLGKWLRSGALIVAIYGLTQMLVAGVHLHRVPAYTSLFLWSLLTTAAVVGFVFKDRAFCRAFCPVGLLLGTYGRGAMLAVRSRSSRECGTCTSNDCTRACNRTRLDGRSCPSLLNPARLNSNADCLVCGQCLKVCQPDNMGLFLRRPFHPADAREALASWPVTLFVMLASGFVISELCSEWAAAKHIFVWIPEEATTWLGRASLSGWVEGVWTLLAVPALVWLLLGALVVTARGATGLGDAWRRLALPLAVVIAAGHMCKGLAKVISWIGFLPLAARDPVGAETVRGLAAKTMPPPAALLPMTAVSVMAMVLVLTAAYFALREVRLAQGETSERYVAPVLALAGSFLFIVFGWGFLT
jgi:polyferredoxin